MDISGFEPKAFSMRTKRDTTTLYTLLTIIIYFNFINNKNKFFPLRLIYLKKNKKIIINLVNEIYLQHNQNHQNKILHLLRCIKHLHYQNDFYKFVLKRNQVPKV